MPSSYIINEFNRTGNKDFKNFREAFIHYLVKKGNYSFLSFQEDLKIENYQSYYFLNNSSLNESNYGVAAISEKKEIRSFFEKCTVNSISITDNYDLIKDATPPCSAMLINDAYLFSNDKNKLANLVKLIEIYKDNSLCIPFHLTVLTKYTYQNNKYVSPTFMEKVVETLNCIKNLKFEILLSTKLPLDDRLILTNYTKGSIGHPFDDRPTLFNQNFLGTSNNILRDYKDYFDSLSKFNSFITDCPDKIGQIITKYNNGLFQNRLFQNVR
jgi:hypothetical protein